MKHLDEDACTLEQAQQYRKRLREVGVAQFLRETVFSKSILARKLITAFGIRPVIGVLFLSVSLLFVKRNLKKESHTLW